MSDSSEWELSKENVQPRREGRKVAALTSALQHTPTDLRQIKDQRTVFEQEIRMYEGDDPLEIWDRYIKWTEENFPRGVKDGNLLELLQRCLTHFQYHDGYKNDPRFLHIWVKFANFIDNPVEIYQHMFDQGIGSELALLYEEWANFLERLGNTKKADSIYLEGITRCAQPLDVLKVKHSEFQMRVARGLCLQPREEESDRQGGQEQRSVLGRLKADKKNHVGTTRTGSAKLGTARGLGGGQVPVQQRPSTGFQVFQDENAPPSLQQTGEYKTIPAGEQFNRENEQAPGVWTKARAPQRRGVALAAATPTKPAFDVYQDVNAKPQQHSNVALVDSHVLSARKVEKPGHFLDPIRKGASTHERPMYCKEKVYCGTQEFSFEELRGLKYFEKKKKQEQEEEQKKLEEQLNEMRLMRAQFQKDLENMRNEQRQLYEMQRQMQMNLSRESSSVQPSPMLAQGSFQSTQNSSSSNALPFSAPSSASFNSGQPVAPASFNTAPQSASFTNVPPSASFNAAPSSSFNAAPLSAPSSGSFSGPVSSGQLSASFTNPQTSAVSSAPSSTNSSLHKRPTSGTGVQNASLNLSQRTPNFNASTASLGSAGQQQHCSRSTGPTPDGNSSRHSLTSASPTINMKEALQMVHGMYNVTLSCDKINEWTQEDTEVTEAVQPQPASAPVLVYDESAQKPTRPAPIPVFCDENAPNQENRHPRDVQMGQGHGGSEGRRALQEKQVAPTPAPVPDFNAEDDGMGERTDFYSQYNLTLAAVGSQDSFIAAARVASTPFAMGRNEGTQLPALPLSSIKPQKTSQESTDVEMTDAGGVQSSESEAQQSWNAPFRTFNTTRATPTKSNLSTIIEGSSGGSSEESKSHAASSLAATSTWAVKTPAHPKARVSDLDTDSMQSTDKHVIDISQYIPAEADEKTEAILSMSVCIDPHNPFDSDTIKKFLKRIRPPLDQREGYVVCNQHVPNFSGCHFINLGMDTYEIRKLIGEGGYAKVYHADIFKSDEDTMDLEQLNQTSYVIKVQKPPAPWEYYICSEIHQRLQKLGLGDMRPCMMEITQGYFYQDGSCLVSDFCPLGSLLSHVNKLKKHRDLLCNLEPVACFLTAQLLRIVESLHRCHIIHGDIKPDNIMLTGLFELPPGYSQESVFGAHNQCLRLLDFGQAIDMSLYPADTTFMAKVGTEGFQCIEMMTDQPWTYQTDMFGLAGSIHTLVFGQYMKVYCSQGHWYMTSNFQRKWNVELWKKLFHQLLNIADCDHQPNLSGLRREFEDHFMTNLAPRFNNLLKQVKVQISH